MLYDSSRLTYECCFDRISKIFEQKFQHDVQLIDVNNWRALFNDPRVEMSKHQIKSIIFFNFSAKLGENYIILKELNDYFQTHFTSHMLPVGNTLVPIRATKSTILILINFYQFNKGKKFILGF